MNSVCGWKVWVWVGGREGGCEVMSQWGIQVFQFGQLGMSLRVCQTREAGAETGAEAWMVRLADSRGT